MCACGFIGINFKAPFGKHRITVKRKNGKTPGDQTMMATTRKRLEKFYIPFNVNLIQLLEATDHIEVLPSMQHMRDEFLYTDL